MTGRYDDPDEFHRVNDLALVAVLSLQGHTPQSMEMDGRTCYWIFRVSDGLMDVIDDFGSHRSAVEPREYNREFSRLKKEMFTFINETRQPV